jgi:hypothetical protein
MAPTNTKKATKLADPKATVIRISLTGLAKKPRVRKGAVLRGDGLEEGDVDALLVEKAPNAAKRSNAEPLSEIANASVLLPKRFDTTKTHLRHRRRF